MSKILLLQGNQAVVEGAIAAGVKFFGGYPITPSTEVAESLAERLPLVGGKFIQMEDEIASMGAIIGAALTGKKVMTATSGPGFSTKIAKSGQRVSHWPHWIHLSSATTSTFSISLIAKTCLGQNATQIPQPLQRFVWTFRLIIATSFFLKNYPP